MFQESCTNITRPSLQMNTHMTKKKENKTKKHTNNKTILVQKLEPGTVIAVMGLTMILFGGTWTLDYKSS